VTGPLFHDREEAGRRLAQLLSKYRGRTDAVVLALPRGGVPVGFEIASALDLPLDVFLVRKLGVPGQEELAMGAVASGGVRVLNVDVVHYLGIPSRVIDAVEEAERRVLEERNRRYRGSRPGPLVHGRTVLLVDDGLATGSTMKAAVAALKSRGPSRVVVGVPVSPADTLEEMRTIVDDVVCAETPEPFLGVGRWYEAFPQTSDEQVHELLERSRAVPAGRVSAS
jgi:predicted phosphoribosyltransferase